MAEVTDFQLVYDAQRHLFAIGFNVTTGQLDGSYYDLLASEARLASLVAIAFGQIPQTHWFRLGRQLAPADGGRALLSWSGTMFEYLMPLLIARNYEQTLLDETARAVVARHIEYARRRGVPWGISESAYNTMDLALNYQYRAFGVPGLGLKPGLADDLVVSPYSTALALQVDARAATRNLRALMREGMDGRFGFYEAIDYTQGRVPPGRRAVVVRAFMAHHQGMTLLALDNVLRDGVMVRRFHADPRVRATELLLQERVPGTVDLIDVQSDGTEVSRLAPAPELGATERIGHLDGPIPSTLLLSNGTYAVLVTAVGRRSKYLSRPRANSLARGRDARRRGHCLLRPGSGDWRHVVDRLPAHARGAGRISRRVYARGRALPSPRWRHRDGDRDHGVAGGARRGATGDAYQSGCRRRSASS